MKNRAVILFVILLSSISLTSAFAQTKAQTKAERKAEARAEQKRIVISAVEARDLEIDVTRTMPFRGRNIPLSGGYSVKIKGDSIYSHLPYFGRAYNIPYGGGEGLIFKGVMQQYGMQSKKDRFEINFNVKTNEDRYMFNIDIGHDGRSTIRVNPGNKQSISFSGELDMEPDRKK